MYLAFPFLLHKITGITGKHFYGKQVTGKIIPKVKGYQLSFFPKGNRYQVSTLTKIIKAILFLPPFFTS